MNITLFNQVTTEAALVDIEAEAENYQGLYVEMSDPKQRKYIKESASVITRLLTQIDRARIDLAKNFKREVEDEASSIKGRLEKANEPFTLLLDDYNTERKRVLDAEKDRKAQAEAEAQKEVDHEYAMLLDKSYLADKLAAEKAQAEHDEAIRVDARAKTEEALKSKLAYEEACSERDEKARLANKDHVRKVNRAIYHAFIAAHMTKDAATIATQSLIDSKVPHITINY